MTTINHFANSLHVPAIYEDNAIQLEGYNLERLFKETKKGIFDTLLLDRLIMQQIDVLDKSTKQNLKAFAKKEWKIKTFGFRASGRYVWFTEENACNSINQTYSFEKIAFKFDAETINAKKWSLVRASLIAKQPKRALYINALEANARQQGDDPNKWWVTKTPVSLDNALGNPLTQSQLLQAA